MIETWLRTDVKNMVSVTKLTGHMFSADNNGNLIGVELLDNGEPVALEGTVTGYVIRPDDKTLVITGEINENKASIILPRSAYAVVGRISIVIKVGETTIGACTGNVYKSTTDTIIDPGHVIPSLEELLEQIENCREATDDANEAADLANEKALLADEKATLAEEKAGDANDAAILANSKAELADEKATLADEKATLANEKASDANDAAILANAKAALADEKATLANTKATLADTKAGDANDAAILANAKAALADEKAALANEKATFANTAGNSANTAAALANEKATLADTKATLANTKAELADEKAGIANDAAEYANESAELAESKATLANQAATAANTAAGKINNMTVSVSGLSPSQDPTVSISEVSGHKHISFGIPAGIQGERGKDFRIKRTFESIEEMEEYDPDEDHTIYKVLEFDYVMIDTGSVQDPDTGKLYCYEPITQEIWHYIGDLSGAQGIKGDTGNGIANIVLNQDYTLTVNCTDGTSYTTPSIRGATGATGATGNGIASTVLNNDYTLTITFTDGTSYTTGSIRGATGATGETGPTGATGNGIASVALNSDYTLTITFTDGTSTRTSSIRGATGATGNGIASTRLNSDYTLTITFTDGTTYTTESIRGATGPTGPTGATGATGPTGATGNGISGISFDSTTHTLTITMTNGDTYTTGSIQGDVGATPNFTIGTVTTIEPDQQASATITGTAENPVLNLSIPRGQTGSTANIYATNVPMSTSDSTTVYNAIGAKISTTEKGSANGVAELDSSGKVPASQLPSYVDDVESYASLSNFPATGEDGKIYIAKDTNITYRWGGSSYVAIGSDLALGETSSTAYRGDRGKAAYDAAVVNPDSTPTSGSTHLLTSGGAYTALDDKAPKANPVFTGSISMGRASNTTIGSGSVAEGTNTTASGAQSHAEGASTTASGANSHAEGAGTTASGSISHAEGAGTVASGQWSHSEGSQTTASNNNSHAEGSGDRSSTKTVNNTTYTGTGAHGASSHSEGNVTWAIGANSHAEGSSTTASGIQSHAEGGGTTASGNNSHSEGASATASGDNSHSEGAGTTAFGANSHAEGASTVAVGNQSHAEGVQSIAYGDQSHAEGTCTLAEGASSHVSGIYNVADSYANWPEWVSGTFYDVGDKVKITTTSNNTTTIVGYICTTANTDTTFTSSKWKNQYGKMNYAEIVGNGTGTSARSNARALDWSGNEYLNGDLYINCNDNSTGGSKVISSADVMTGATSSSAGSAGLVPAPGAGDEDKVLKGDGTWSVVSSGGSADIFYVTGAISNSGGQYSDTIEDERVTEDMQPVHIEVTDKTAFMSEDIYVSCENGYITIECDDVNGESDIVVYIFGSQNTDLMEAWTGGDY